MVKDHYIPAAFLGRFSVDTESPGRKRTLHILRRGVGSSNRVRAEDIGFEPDYYRLKGRSFETVGDVIDPLWMDYERRLGPALDELIDPSAPTVDGGRWVRVLVPFIAAAFVRTPEYGRRFQRQPIITQMAGSQKADSEWAADNTNLSRLLSLQRLLTLVMASEWIIMHSVGEPSIIINDIGFSAYNLPNRARKGVALPLSRNCVLGLPSPGDRERVILVDAGDGRWRAPIQHVWLGPGNQVGLNERLARQAHNFIAGAQASDVLLHIAAMRGEVAEEVNFRAIGWPHPSVLREQEFDWHRVVTMLARKARDGRSEPQPLPIDWGVVASGWHPPPFLQVGGALGGTGLRLRGLGIRLAMASAAQKLG